MSGLGQRFLFFFATFFVVAILTHNLCAELIPLAHYSLGEEDPDSSEGNPVTQATDSIAFGGTARDMTPDGVVDSVINTAFTPSGIESSKSVLFAGGYLSTDATPWHSLYDGFRVGMEAWINVDEIGEEMVPFGNSNAYYFSIDSEGSFHAHAGGTATEATEARVTPGEWQHVAFWTTGSFWQVYVDGEAQLDPLGNFNYGGPAGTATIGADQNGERIFSGFMDEMRVFRWTGAFDPADLLYFTQRLAGDVNEDGIVNTDDYNIWRMNVDADLSELTLLEGRGLGDVDVNGVIDLDDFALIKENRTPGAAFVPEPSSVVTALLALLGWIGFCRRCPATLR
jgi:hypothetical protein